MTEMSCLIIMVQRSKHYEAKYKFAVIVFFYSSLLTLTTSCSGGNCSYCSDQIHCVTFTGNNKLIFGEGTKLTVESREYQQYHLNSLYVSS